jgi:hypothetical protein
MAIIKLRHELFLRFKAIDDLIKILIKSQQANSLDFTIVLSSILNTLEKSNIDTSDIDITCKKLKISRGKEIDAMFPD